MSAFANCGRAVAHFRGSYVAACRKRAQQFGKQFAKKTDPFKLKGAAFSRSTFDPVPSCVSCPETKMYSRPALSNLWRRPQPAPENPV